MQNITIRQGYLASFNFLDWVYFNRGKSDDLGSLLSEMNPRFWGGCMSADPATWLDWVDSADRVVSGIRDGDKPEWYQIHPEVTYDILRVFLRLYESQDLYHNNWVFDAMATDPEIRDKWNEFLHNAEHEIDPKPPPPETQTKDR